jgi:hypothetical protein
LPGRQIPCVKPWRSLAIQRAMLRERNRSVARGHPRTAVILMKGDHTKGDRK